MKIRYILISALAGVLLSTSLCFAYEELVRVMRVNHNKVVVSRNNGEVYELHISGGCPSIANYINYMVHLECQNGFLAGDTRIALRGEHQACPVYSYTTLLKQQGGGAYNQPNPYGQPPQPNQHNPYGQPHQPNQHNPYGQPYQPNPYGQPHY